MSGLASCRAKARIFQDAMALLGAPTELYRSLTAPPFDLYKRSPALFVEGVISLYRGSRFPQ